MADEEISPKVILTNDPLQSFQMAYLRQAVVRHLSKLPVKKKDVFLGGCSSEVTTIRRHIKTQLADMK